MAFTELEISAHMQVLEDSFWAQRRPPLHLRDRIREGQRFTDQSVELFFVRPAYNRPGEEVEEPIAKLQYLPSKQVWCIFWQRADCRWHRYAPCPEAASLAAALSMVNADPNGCFFG